jgi:hypothetical protein
MTTEIKELFDEMLTYKRRDNLPKHYMKHLLVALEKGTNGNFSLTITWLLNWIKESNRNATNKEICEFDHENDKDRFQELFKYCITIHNIFVLDINSITWQDSISEEEKSEILDYVDMNYDWKMRVRKK